MASAAPLGEISLAHGTDKIWTELPRLCVILAGGFVSNFLWCAFLIWKNGTGRQFLTHQTKEPTGNRVPMVSNYLFCTIAGTTWYLQFFFYSMGETKMGVYQFASWPLHMASIMIFSSLWGIVLLEWRGASAYTKSVLGLTLTTLIFSTIVMGYGTHIGKIAKETEMRELSEQVCLIVLSSNGNSMEEACIDRTKRILTLAKEVGLAETDSEQIEKVQQTLELAESPNAEKAVWQQLSQELQRLTGFRQ
jgi:hypothetical protein